MTSLTVLAVGAHIGDMDLAAGPYLAQNVLDGGRSALVALTPGERGHPRLTPAEYRLQKIAEGEAFAAGIGAEFTCFDDLSDGFLTADDDVAMRLARIIRELRPDILLAHWVHSIHTDHEHAARIAIRARFLAGLPGVEEDGETPATTRHGVPRVLHCENWEDDHGFVADRHAPVGEEAFTRWHAAISGQAFARGETYGFRYIDYYSAQLQLRGALGRTERAVAFAPESGSRMTQPIRNT
ncbi:LmbE family protein [Beutenbergia cavernae DSM 12333]|uniref:LmbE family protein n=1 Tax=Beutenbergia cavernae (strain ATCC BAA-8 / DSM 12333 / CCUG 43141 / JCM 11478 / NBRC 16432 / NCIMB 13614 / HKI 0122) TaxID=471853 RepID=C5C2G8_BEUC1|nr:PIG-L family deacetylase [Beutenbergia cavernae]ACQ79654.1 LmbE family protein [Beutenbergia cavernae DSM 12333]